MHSIQRDLTIALQARPRACTYQVTVILLWCKWMPLLLIIQHIDVSGRCRSWLGGGDSMTLHKPLYSLASTPNKNEQTRTNKCPTLSNKIPHDTAISHRIPQDPRISRPGVCGLEMVRKRYKSSRVDSKSGQGDSICLTMLWRSFSMSISMSISTPNEVRTHAIASWGKRHSDVRLCSAMLGYVRLCSV